MMRDIYEFPEGFSGRKTYVSVAGHARSIPVIYTYKSPSGLNKLLPEYGGGPIEYSGRGPMIMRDISPYRSIVDNSMISSRSQHREHLVRHDLVEIGNERIAPPVDTAPSKYEIGKKIKERIDAIKPMPQRQYDAFVEKQKQELTTE